MKFVFDKKTGQMVPDTWLERRDEEPLHRQVFDWLDKSPYIPKRFSFLTRSIAYEFFRTHGDVDGSKLDEVRDAIADWYNKNHKLADSAQEDCGGIGPMTGGLSGGGPAIASPVLPKDKKKKADESISSITGGDCFIQAWNNFYSNLGKSVLLVHGIVTGQGRLEGIKYNHAWIELGDSIVIDTTIPQFANGVSKEEYYRLAQITDKTPLFKYTSRDIAEKATKWKTYGPWEDILWQYP